MLAVAGVCLVLVALLVVAIVLIARTTRRLSAEEKRGERGQALGYLTLLLCYAGMTLALVGGCCAVFDVLGRIVPGAP